MRVLSCVGNHNINIYAGAEFDPSVRKFRGGVKVAEIPFSGVMLGAKAEQVDDAPISIDGVEIPTKSPQKWIAVDPLPEDNDGETLYVVSAMYVAARKELGLPTNMLLTVGQTVVDESGRVCGCVNLNRN